MELEDLGKLCISVETRPKQQHINEARRIIQTNSKYRNDPNYKFFLDEVIVGLCRDGSNKSIFEAIRTLQRMVKPRKQRSILED